MNNDEQSQFSKTKNYADDPRLTAYALGEMDASERAAFETEINLRNNPGAQAAIAEIRDMAGELKTAFTVESAPVEGVASDAPASPVPEEDWRAAREAEARERRKNDPYGRTRKRHGFPYFLTSGLAGALFTVLFFAVIKPEFQRNRKPPVAEQPLYVSLPVEIAHELQSKEPIPAITFPAAPEKKADYAHTQKTMPAAAGQSRRVLASAVLARSPQPALSRTFNTESYAYQADNKFQRIADHPLSTFSVDVDTASYSNVRRFLAGGRMPPADAVRIEELLNYFPYRYAPPAKDSATPFAATMEVAAAPWNPEHRLVRIGIKGREFDEAGRPAANLVFLLDVSGSMGEPNKLPLVKESMRMLVEKLRPDDRVAIVTYAGNSGLALPSTLAGKKRDILEAIDELRPGGSTNGAMGIQLAYDIAKANFIKDGANRVILCTDGDFNVGVTNQGELTRLIEEKAKSGVFLTVLGYGMGNYKDSTLELLANKGNGNYAYIDSRLEAQRTLVEQAGGTLVTIAKDVKLQVEFNPQQAASYRLIGYENRMLAKEDFNNDKVDAGEIGAGHTVTALYEVVPANAKKQDAPPEVDPLKYQTASAPPPRIELKQELLTLKIRFKAPSSDMSDKVEFVLEDKGAAFDTASDDFKFATAVAGFGMVLRDSPDKGLATFDSVLAWAEPGATAANDADGRRTEFLDLVRRAKQIARN